MTYGTPRHGRGVRHSPGVMNKLEAKYAAHLELRRRAGEIVYFAFESIKLKLADKTYLTPDFMVQLADNTLESHEVKGHWEDDARVKSKLAAKHHPFRFICVTEEKGRWIYEVLTREEIPRPTPEPEKK